ncbi:MAG: hypothetical protein HPAVJP_4930 [Candidatus Hepatoplasma vulgare]|nr:MAG: hypothetical protein HPAVJP_4930 [Candidatus Hepatoplasma sp.]
MGTIRLKSELEKKLYDIVYISHEDLKIKVDKNLKQDRPCIIVKIDKKKELYYVLLLTSKKRFDIRQIKIEEQGNYINLTNLYVLSKNIINYADETDFSLNNSVIREVKNYINKLNL